MRIARLLACYAGFVNVALALEVASPDGLLVMQVGLAGGGAGGGQPAYSVSWRGREIISESRLGLELAGQPLGPAFEILGEERTSADRSWTPVCGERAIIPDRFNELALTLRERNTFRRILRIIARVYDEGAAFSYTLPGKPEPASITINGELTEFRLADDFSCWAAYSAQGVYTNAPASQVRSGCERPLVMRAAADCFIALAEARLVDYARMKFGPLKDHPHGLVAELASSVTSTLPLRAPWRVIMVGKTPGQLLEQNYLLGNLNDPCAISDTSWIKPGKVIREVTLTTTGGKACVDFAVKRNLQYIEFDAGWYGPENSDASDARAVNLDPRRSKGPLDLQEVIRYGAERGIGVILYVNHRALERQMDELFPLYQRWGVKGVKFGFVNVGSQQWTAWLHEAVRKAAEHKLMVDVHDEYRPTGWSRTYPNLMTQEGIRGDEERQPNEQALTTLFTRMIAGAADNTICYYDARVAQQSSHAYQLAKSVCFFSPWQFLYWYDRPSGAPPKTGGAGGAETSIGDEAELEFFDHLPVTWEDTKVLEGVIGRYAVIARRKGADWFLGAMNASEPRSLDVDLSFLEAARDYDAWVYSDDPSVPTRTQVRIDRRALTAGQRLKLELPARGGQALRIIPRQAN